MNIDEQSTPVETSWLRRLLGHTLLLLLVFLLGFIPMWEKSRKARSRLARTRKQLRLARTRNSLASATIDAFLGNYESARQSAGDFFTAVRVEIDKREYSALSLVQRESVVLLLNQRDAMITLLARSDPNAAAQLLDLYSAYREIVN
ncbi:MAG: hypothetical protein JW892_10485 [Anaerolineae bacterium]|nr:hypothetical protein [Anaerolineae bacterium]